MEIKGKLKKIIVDIASIAVGIRPLQLLHAQAKSAQFLQDKY